MAQIRSKQIQDFLSTVNWGTVTNSQIPNAIDTKDYVDAQDSAEASLRVSGDASLGNDLTSEASYRVSADASLATNLATEIAARVAGDTYATTVITVASGAPTNEVTSPVAYKWENNEDLMVFVNGVTYDIVTTDGNVFTLNLAFDLEENDVVKIVGIVA